MARKKVQASATGKPAGPIDLAGFIDKLTASTDPSRMDKATRMLKADRFQLYAEVTGDHVTGVVKSQTDSSLVYACRLSDQGAFMCCTQNLRPCGGLRGALCKHLLVLLIGLAQESQLDPGHAHAWAVASRNKKPALDAEEMSATFIKYKGAQAGEVDWRPTETIPEDYYAL
jgi:hypothetical protein